MEIETRKRLQSPVKGDMGTRQGRLREFIFSLFLLRALLSLLYFSFQVTACKFTNNMLIA